ncbi:MAG TPA: DUF5916 domain-containing protein, partial [Acidobacteriota bacterium]|nr:DUF5916 domain-containing protein [Acidobacteriota bacterium]
MSWCIVAVLALVAPLAFVCLTGNARVWAQTADDVPRKEMTATRVNGMPPKLDGRLDEAVWQTAVMVSDFVQKEPDYGSIPEDRTEVGFLYDDHFLYVGARMHCREPEKMRLELNRRDSPGGSEQIIISLDTYCDRRTCFEFGVSAAGVRDDRYHATDDEGNRDRTYNPVWEGQADVNDSGWTAEMRIPFSQLRFNKTDRQVWGVNVNRWIPARNEDNFLVAVPRDETGWSSRFWNLVGIAGIAPSRRIELTPYAASDGRFISDPDPGDPFDDGSEFDGRVGTDLKMGLGPNLTLDATINPDFGQVEADPADVNLTAYETYFSEKRPFFIERSQLFESIGPQFFYSRRIGAPPHGNAEGDFIDMPSNTTILGAGKLTGRFQTGTSVGVLGAVTSRETAQIFDTEDEANQNAIVEPVAGYGLVRVQQEVAGEGSTVGVILTGMERDIDGGDPLAETLRRRAVAGGAEWKLRFSEGMYQVFGNLGFSHVTGDAAAILATQKSSARYYQRPDADYVSIDSARTSLSGYAAMLGFEKRSGRHWLWELGGATVSPGFEVNDLGRLSTVDDIDTWGNIRYRETQPGSVFRSYSIQLFGDNAWNYGGVRQSSDLGLYVDATLLSYYSFWTEVGQQFPSLGDSRTRGGPLMGIPRAWWFSTGISNNHAAKTNYSASVFTLIDEDDGWEYSFSGQFSTRAGRRWSFSVAPRYYRGLRTRQYVDQLGGGPAATYGGRYVFASIDQSQLSAQFRLSYFFTPDLSLEVYAEPFAASGRYYDFGELTEARGRDLRVYGETPGTSISGPDDDGTYVIYDDDDRFEITQSDFGYHSFRSSTVLRWEFRRGSTLYLVWQQ